MQHNKPLIITIACTFVSSLWAVQVAPKREALIVVLIFNMAAYILMMREQKKEKHERV